MTTPHAEAVCGGRSVSTPFVEVFEVEGDAPRVAIKDSLDIAGYPTRLGSAVYEQAAKAVADAAVVVAVRQAGCQVVGKTKMHEFAYGVTGLSGPAAPTNPDFPGHIPGGSSSGSAAAVAAGLADFALGSDTGGSIRVPAACCGVFGLKPTFGRISRAGACPPESQLDCVGPFANSATDLIAAMAILDDGFEPADRAEDFTLGRVRLDADPVVQDAVTRALDQTGKAIVEIELPGLAAAFAAGVTLMAREAWSAFGAHVDDPRLGPDVAARLRGAALVTDAQVAQAHAVREAFTSEVDLALEAVSFIALPTLPGLPLTLAEAADAKAALRITAFVRPFNVSGHPALTIPLREPSGLPVGLQLVGRKGDDARLCAAADFIARRATDTIVRTPRKRDAS